MKRLVLFVAIIIVPLLATAQKNKTTTVTTTTINTTDSIFMDLNKLDPMGGPSAFAKCFTNCDLNKDGKVSYAEAEKATKLSLDYGGRKNIISDYSFLKYFPNLTHLSIGNTPNEQIDLSNNPKLEVIDLRNGLWVKEMIIVAGCNPQIFFPMNDETVCIKRVKK